MRGTIALPTYKPEGAPVNSCASALKATAMAAVATAPAMSGSSGSRR